MKKPITRLGDKSSSGDTAVEGTSTIFINGLPVVVLGDRWLNFETSTTGSPTVFFENKAVVRVGDLLSNKDTVAQGSPNTFAGDGTPPAGHRTWAQMIMMWKDAVIQWFNA